MLLVTPYTPAKRTALIAQLHASTPVPAGKSTNMISPSGVTSITPENIPTRTPTPPQRSQNYVSFIRKKIVTAADHPHTYPHPSADEIAL